MPDGTCTIEDCEKPIKCRGLCNMHYRRWWRRGGDTDTGPTESQPRCTVDSCDRPRRLRGRCRMHYQQWRQEDDDHEVCVVEDCVNPQEARGWCNTHYLRWRRCGTTAEVPRPSLSDHHNWGGDDVKCAAVHARLRRTFGPASDYTCGCGEPAVDWAYDHGCPNERIEIMTKTGGRQVSVPFSTDLDRYEPMCRTCHRRFDLDRRRDR